MRSELEHLGWDAAWELAADALDPDTEPARLAVEYQDRVTVEAADGPLEATLSGRLRDVDDRLDRPAVGDWVGIRRDSGVVITQLLPRRSLMVRRAAGVKELPQIVAANVDSVFVVSSATREFNPRRLERYVASIHASGATPVLVLNKADLDDPAPYLAQLDADLADLETFVTSALNAQGLDALRQRARPGETVAFVGSSGVGKSTLVNAVLGEQRVAVGDVRGADHKGRHTTRNRRLIATESGAILVDTPGMRELQLWADSAAIDRAFADVIARAADCRFRNCSHGDEPDCAVRDAVANGALSAARVASYRKLAEELEQAQLRAPQRRGRRR